MSTEKKLCTVEGCTRPFLAKGMCNLHWHRKRTGITGEAFLAPPHHGGGRKRRKKPGPKPRTVDISARVVREPRESNSEIMDRVFFSACMMAGDDADRVLAEFKRSYSAKVLRRRLAQVAR